MTPGRRGDGRAARSATSRHRATWGIERGEWKDLGEVSRGQQSLYRSFLLKEKENCHGQALPHPLRVSSLSMTIFLKIFSSCLSCSSWIKDMLCYPRETSPRSFHSPGSIPQVAHVRGGLLRCASTPVRRPGVIHGVTPPGSVPARSEPLLLPGVSAHIKS